MSLATPPAPAVSSSASRPAAAPPTRPTASEGRSGRPLLLGIVLVGAIVVVAWLFGWIGGSGGETRSGEGRDVHTVSTGGFNIVIPVSGELAAVRQVEIRNRLESRAMITSIVDEGRLVRRGETIVTLADEEIRNRIKDAEDKLNGAQSDLVAAEQNLQIRLSARESDLEKADLQIQLARLALQAWEEGEVVAKREELALSKQTAEINAARLESRFNDAARLVEQDFLSRDEFEQDRIRMIEAQARVRQAELAIFLYEQFEYHQQEARKRSDLEQAVAERGRVEQRHDAELIRIRADVESRRFALATQQDRLADLRRQLDSCVIVAPSDGLLVYASSVEEGRRGRGGGDVAPPSVGTELRPNELIAILPDTSEMVALLKVSEALSGRIQAGQSVNVFSDALPDLPLSGRVLSVSVLAESGGWRDPNRRDYTVRVLVDADPELGLKPAMRARAEILLDRVDDAVWVPIQAVQREGPVAFVHIAEGRGFAQRPVVLGRAGELQVEIASGLAAGERVLLRRPSLDEVIARLDPEMVERARLEAAEAAQQAALAAQRAAAQRPQGGPPRGGAGRPPQAGAAGATGARPSARPEGAASSATVPATEAATAASEPTPPAVVSPTTPVPAPAAS